jgi:hypothetical protein
MAWGWGCAGNWRAQAVQAVQAEMLAVGAPAVMLRLITLPSDRLVSQAAIVASIAQLYGGNEAVQSAFFREIKLMKDVNFYKVMFDRIGAATKSLMEAVKEVGGHRAYPAQSDPPGSCSRYYDFATAGVLCCVVLCCVVLCCVVLCCVVLCCVVLCCVVLCWALIAFPLSARACG